MDLSVALSAFALLFLAEMGDKSQLLAMTLAHRYRTAPVIAGTLLAFLVLNLLAVVLGQALFNWIPQELVLITAGCLFLFFAYRSWQDADGDVGEDTREQTATGAFLTSFTMILVAELGDKTQLAMIALVASTGEVWPVFIGGTLALWLVSLVGILVGATLLKRIPRKAVHRAAAVLFLVFGALTLGQALLGENVLALATGSALLRT